MPPRRRCPRSDLRWWGLLKWSWGPCARSRANTRSARSGSRTRCRRSALRRASRPSPTSTTPHPSRAASDGPSSSSPCWPGSACRYVSPASISGSALASVWNPERGLVGLYHCETQLQSLKVVFNCRMTEERLTTAGRFCFLFFY